MMAGFIPKPQRGNTLHSRPGHHAIGNPQFHLCPSLPPPPASPITFSSWYTLVWHDVTEWRGVGEYQTTIMEWRHSLTKRFALQPNSWPTMPSNNHSSPICDTLSKRRRGSVPPDFITSAHGHYLIKSSQTNHRPYRFDEPIIHEVTTTT
ncbi:hypothetical protein CDAR_207361 [Caerostris darwini]|uniref:Uncharacterized protein n=1 Tax=Caerostris darwini TaxID=1538125 RepID=A0AAV4VHL5_9ARAC|nr:hypothetical protein CDAR_207361 [Caerostris darwini]